MELANAHCLVTGASRGIGLAVARELAARGARLTLVARNAVALAHVADELGGYAMAADLLDPAEVDGLMERAEATGGGPVQVLVNNAGIDLTMSFVEMTSADIERIHRINLIVPIELTRQALPSMIANGGHVVNMSSMAASGGFPGMSAYCSTKAGLSHFTRVLRLELRGTSVKLTAVEIGPVPTDMLAGITYPPAEQAFRRMRRAQLMPNVTAERVARSVADAIERDRRAVRLPRRTALFPLLSALPQRCVEPLLRGIA